MLLASLLVGVSAFLLAVAALRLLLLRRLHVLSALAAMEREGEPEAADDEPVRPARAQGRQRLRQALRPLVSALRLGPLRRWAEAALRGSGLPLRPEEFLAICVAAPAVLWLLGAAAGLPGFVHLAVAALGLAGLPLLARRARARRDTAISLQLGDVLTTVGNGLRAGHSLLQALDGAARSSPAPIGDELRRMQRETVAGIPVDEALVRMKDRTGNEDLELFVTAVLVQHQVGGNLAEVLDKISSTIRSRVQVQNHLRVVTAQSRMSGWVVAVVPVAVFGLTTLIAPEVERALTGDPLGRVVAVLALVLEVVGALVIRKVVSVRY